MATPDQAVGKGPQLTPNLLLTIKRIASRFSTAEAISWVEGASIAYIFFELSRNSILPPDLAGIVLFAGDSFSFMVTNYLMRLQEQSADKGNPTNHHQFLNPVHYLNGFLRPASRVTITWTDRAKAARHVLIEFGPLDIVDIPVRISAYTLLGHDFRDTSDPTLWPTFIKYTTSRGPVEVLYYTWPTLFNLGKYFIRRNNSSTSK